MTSNRWFSSILRIPLMALTGLRLSRRNISGTGLNRNSSIRTTNAGRQTIRHESPIGSLACPSILPFIMSISSRFPKNGMTASWLKNRRIRSVKTGSISLRSIWSSFGRNMESRRYADIDWTRFPWPIGQGDDWLALLNWKAETMTNIKWIVYQMGKDYEAVSFDCQDTARAYRKHQIDLTGDKWVIRWRNFDTSIPITEVTWYIFHMALVTASMGHIFNISETQH